VDSSEIKNAKGELSKFETPVFVVGPLRSGTTLLRLILDHHSEINSFGEFETAVSQCVGDSWPDLEAFDQLVKTDRQARSQGLEVDLSLSYPELIFAWLKKMDARKPVRHIGASVHSRIDMLAKLWPNGKYIHLLRDPRDVARSCIGMGWVGNVYEGAQYWISAERHWDILFEHVEKENCYEIRYEDLVESPEEELRALCCFLDIEYEANMLNLGEDTSYSKPSKKYANQWQQKQTKKEIGWVESRCANLMAQRGYERITNEQEFSMFYRMLLKLHSRILRLMFNIKRFGLIFSIVFGMARLLRLKALSHRLQKRRNAIEIKFLK